VATIAFVRIDWDHKAFPLSLPGVRLHTLRVDPEPDYPFGRKGRIIQRGWEQLREPGMAGMVILDGDVATDPYQVDEMFAALDSDPKAVWVAPAKIWPQSTRRPRWVWAHRAGEASQEMATEGITFFSFCFTYLPSALIDRCVKAGMSDWTFPTVDQRVSRVARESRTRIRVVEGIEAIHLHY
jgi:hypothetical protein